MLPMRVHNLNFHIVPRALLGPIDVTIKTEVGYLLCYPRQSLNLSFERNAQPIWRHDNPDITFFGNPEKQFLNFQFFSSINIENTKNFQGNHKDFTLAKSFIIVNLEFKILFLLKKYCKTLISMSFPQEFGKNSNLIFSV